MILKLLTVDSRLLIEVIFFWPERCYGTQTVHPACIVGLVAAPPLEPLNIMLGAALYILPRLLLLHLSVVDRAEEVVIVLYVA